MKEKLENILKNGEQEITNAKTVQDLEEIKVKYLSRKGELTSIKKNLKDLSDEDKRIIGSLANNVYNSLDSLITKKNNEL